MNPISNLWRQLVERRLWPVAVLLVAALAAVPLTLAKEPEAEPAPAPQASSDDSSSELATAPIVAMATDSDRDKRRKVLGKAKNPFVEPPKSETTEDSGPTAVGQANDAAGSAGGSGPTKLADNLTINAGSGGGAPSPSPGGSPVGPAAPAQPDAKPVRRERYSLSVRFGGEDALERMNIKRLEPLPLAEEPLVVYLGVADNGRSAEFLVDSSVNAEGDGRCEPDPSTCETIRLREGETHFFDVLDASGETVGEYQLDLLEIHGSRRTDGRSAAARDAAPGALQDRARTSGVARTAVAGLALR
jgi:hypothetical protein